MQVFRADGTKKVQVTLVLTIEPREGVTLVPADDRLPQRMTTDGDHNWDAFDERAVVEAVTAVLEQWWPKYEMMWEVTDVGVGAWDLKAQCPRG